MEAKPTTITPAGRKFVTVWSVALSMFFVGLGVFVAMMINQLKTTATAREQARIDPNVIELGQTAADTTLPAGANPRKVKVGIYLDSIASISILESSWSPVFYVWFRWIGENINPGETFTIVEGDILSKQQVTNEFINGEHYTVYLVKAQITRYFDTSRFPVDDHLLTIGLEDGDLAWTDLEYVPDTAGSTISARVQMPGYRVNRTAIVMKPHTYLTTFGNPRLPPGNGETYSELIYGIWNARPGLGPYFKVFLGLFAANLIAMLAFFIKPTDVDPRFGLGVGGFFGAVANALLAASLVPDSGVLTLMDMVNGFGIIIIFLTLVQSTVSLYLYDIRGEVALSRRFDQVSIVIIGVGCLVINILFPLLGMGR